MGFVLRKLCTFLTSFQLSVSGRRSVCHRTFFLPAFRRASPESTPSSHVRLDTDGVDVVVVPRRAVEFGAGLVAEQALLQVNLRGGLRQRVLLHLLTCGAHMEGGGGVVSRVGFTWTMGRNEASTPWKQYCGLTIQHNSFSHNFCIW